MTVKTPIYLDYSATTPVDPRVLDAMMPYLTDVFGNAASKSHVFGWRAEEASEKARGQIAEILGAHEKEIIWTSGATEANNLAIKGVVEMYHDKGNHIITAATEHKAVLNTCQYLKTRGCEVTFLPVDDTGRVDPEQVREAITDKTVLVSIMAANNEIGTLAPMAEIGAICKNAGVLFHTDATQAVGKVPLDVQAMGIDLLSCSAHKLYGPKGAGALYVRRRSPRVRLAAQFHGGGHERGMRSGTLNTPGIAGFGTACEIARAEMAEEAPRLVGLRDRLHNGVADRIDEVKLNGHQVERLPQTLNLSFAYVEGEALMMKFKDLAVSSGSACTSASLEPSYVLRALGVGDELAHSSIRFSVGRFTTEEEIDFAIDQVVAGVNALREMSPLYELAKEGVDLKDVQWTGE